jgi:hypothetical protein
LCARSLQIPYFPSGADFEPTTVKFAGTRGDALLLSDKHTFAVAYPVLDQEREDDEATGRDARRDHEEGHFNFSVDGLELER